MRIRSSGKALVVGGPVRWQPGPHPLRECLADLFLTRWVSAFLLPPPRFGSPGDEGALLARGLRDRLVHALMSVALGDPWLESFAPFQARVEYRLGIQAETLRVQVSLSSKQLVLVTPAGRRLGWKASFEGVADEMTAIAEAVLGPL